MSNSCGSASDWKANLVTTDEEASALTSSFRTVAVLGIKTDRQSEQPAFFVAQYLDNAGVKVRICCWDFQFLRIQPGNKRHLDILSSSES